MSEQVLKKIYKDKIVPELKSQLGYANIHQIPTLEKIVINSGIDASSDKNWIDEVVKELSNITGQKAVITKARKSISNFKVREEMPLGAKVTLRGEKMWEFLYRLISVALPIIRDFRGIHSKFDGKGNYNLGIQDHTIFPEIVVEQNKRTLGMDIAIVTTAKDDKEGKLLLSLLGMPFRK